MGQNTTLQGRLQALFHPSSMALVGATDHSRWSVNTYMNLKQTGFSGRVVCVNPNRPAAHGQPAVPSLRALADPPDLAYVMVGPDHVLDVIDDAAAAGVRSLVLLTAGFRESGPAGAALERELKMRVEHYGLTVLGPNGNGFVNMTAGIAPYGLPLPMPMQAGPVGVVLQSGALASAVLALAQARAVGISLLVSMGNEMQIEATDVIEYLVHDEVTRVIALFLETIRNPVRFAETAQLALARGKPLVVLKTGRSQAGARTAMAHTGALVGDHAVHQAVFRQLGVIEVRSLETLITTAGLLGYYGPPPGRRMAVVTASGGACDILSDRAEDEGIALPSFGARTEERLGTLLPPFSTVQNPLDVTGYVVVDRTLQRRALEVVAQDPGFDFVTAVVEPPRTLQPDADTVRASYRALAQAVKESPRPVVLLMNAMTDIPPVGREIAGETGLHFVGGMEHGMAALGHALWWRERREAWLRRHGIDEEAARLEAPPALWRPCAGGGLSAAQRTVDHAAGPGTAPDTGPEGQLSTTWSEWQARAYLEQHGVPVVPGCLATSAGEAAAFAAQWCGPLVLKVQSNDLPHKSDIGGVMLGVRGPEAVRQAYGEVLDRVRSLRPDAQIEGVMVSPQRTGGVELLVGVVRDPLWGPVIAVGMGGVFVEVLRDSILHVLPVAEEDIVEMLRSLRGAPLLEGIRGQGPVNVGRIAAVVRRIADLALAAGDALEALEVNPLWADGERVEALDVLIRWRRAPVGENGR